VTRQPRDDNVRAVARRKDQYSKVRVPWSGSRAESRSSRTATVPLSAFSIANGERKPNQLVEAWS